MAAALYATSNLPDDQLLAMARRMSVDDRTAVLTAYIGERANRRHKPGRAFERTAYRFDVLTDYGAFRDLQRHRLCTIDWQALSVSHGHTQPNAIVEAGGDAEWRGVMARCAEVHDAMVQAGLSQVESTLRRLKTNPPPLGFDTDDAQQKQVTGADETLRMIRPYVGHFGHM